jgi:hypothetical protein
MRRKLILGASALALSLGTLAGVGASTATASSSAVTGTGIVKCSKLTGTIAFSPGISTTKSQVITTTVHSTATGCLGGKPNPTSVLSSSTMKGTKSVTCGNAFTGTNPFKSAETYTPAGSLNPSAFSGTSMSGPMTAKPLYFTVKGTVTGSFKTATGGASAKANLQETLQQIITACGSSGGLKLLHIASGNTVG